MDWDRFIGWYLVDIFISFQSTFLLGCKQRFLFDTRDLTSRVSLNNLHLIIINTLYCQKNTIKIPVPRSRNMNHVSVLYPLSLPSHLIKSISPKSHLYFYFLVLEFFLCCSTVESFCWNISVVFSALQF